MNRDSLGAAYDWPANDDVHGKDAPSIKGCHARKFRNCCPALLLGNLDELRHRSANDGAIRTKPDTKVGTFTQALYDEAKKNAWTVISMKDDWKRIFAFGHLSEPHLRPADCSGARFRSLPGRIKLSMPKSSMVESRSCKAFATVLPVKPQIPVIRTFIRKERDDIEASQNNETTIFSTVLAGARLRCAKSRLWRGTDPENQTLLTYLK